MTFRNRVAAIWRHATPAMGGTSGRELARATLGTGLAIGLTDILLWLLRHNTPSLPGGTGDPLSEVILVSPFAATAFLILTVPNSPLAQPWSVIVGNTAGVAAGAVCVYFLPFPVISAALSVGLAVVVMTLARALHPPGAAMALNAVLFHQAGGDTGPGFVLATVTAGSVLLVAFGMVFNPLTGRRYPFRSADEAGEQDSLTLATILERLKLSANIGVADLSRLIATVEAEATAHHLGHISAASMMTPAPLALLKDAKTDELTAAFREKSFRTIPIVDSDGRYLGLIQHMSLVGADETAVAQDLMSLVPGVEPETEMPEILALLTSGQLRVVPVVSNDRLVGIITRSDLIEVLARALRGGPSQP